MSENLYATTESVEDFSKKHLIFSFIVLVALFAGVGVLGLFYESEIRSLAQWIVDKFGFLGMSLFLFFSDTFVSPIPPDLFLLVIAKSSLRENWYIYVPILGVLSTLAGHLGWFLGRTLVNTPFFAKGMRTFLQSKSDFVKKFGFWGVILGALTPLPFSVTCWTAGILNMPYPVFALAVSTRFIRVLAYYLAFHFTNW